MSYERMKPYASHSFSLGAGFSVAVKLVNKTLITQFLEQK
jgi:hypothetical protein